MYIISIIHRYTCTHTHAHKHVCTFMCKYCNNTLCFVALRPESGLGHTVTTSIYRYLRYSIIYYCTILCCIRDKLSFYFYCPWKRDISSRSIFPSPTIYFLTFLLTFSLFLRKSIRKCSDGAGRPAEIFTSGKHTYTQTHTLLNLCTYVRV